MSLELVPFLRVSLPVVVTGYFAVSEGALSAVTFLAYTLLTDWSLNNTDITTAELAYEVKNGYIQSRFLKIGKEDEYINKIVPYVGFAMVTRMALSCLMAFVSNDYLTSLANSVISFTAKQLPSNVSLSGLFFTTITPNIPIFGVVCALGLAYILHRQYQRNYL